MRWTTAVGWMLLCLAAPAARAADTGAERYVEVTAEATASVRPVEAAVLLVVEDASSSAADSLRVCTERVKRLRSDLAALEMEGLSLRTGPATFRPAERPDFESPRRSLTCRVVVAAALDLQGGTDGLAGRAAALVDAAARTGARPAANPRTGGLLFFRAADPSAEAAGLLAAAVEAARARAQRAAEASGGRLGRVLRVTEMRRRAEPEEPFVLLHGGCPPGEAWTFDGKTLQWRKTVTVRFALEG